MSLNLLDKFSRIVHDKWWWKILVRFIGDIRIYWGGLILWGGSSYKVKGSDMRKILETLKPGDVLLRVYEHYIGSIFVPGFWSHAAIYEGDDKVIHMLGHGICREDILTFMRCDGISVLRCKKPELIMPAIAKARDYLEKGVDYDYGFIRGDTNLYCSELIYQIFNKPAEIKFDNYVLPDDLICDLFTIEYAKDHHKIESETIEKETPFTITEKKEEKTESTNLEK
jgi:hypothetical protein